MTSNDPNGSISRALGSEALRVWRSDQVIQQAIEEYDMNGIRIDSITIKAPAVAGGEMLGVIKGRDQDGKVMVSFRSAPTVSGVKDKIAAGLEDGSLRYKEEVPWAERNKGA